VKPFVIAARVIIGLSGISLLLLGILFWTGRALSLLPVPLVLGVILVLGLWLIAILGLRARAPKGLVALVLVFSLIMPVLGIEQSPLLPGEWHWLVQLLHLLVGFAAIGLGQVLARRIQA
jgi:hypothetical protein